LPVRPIDLEKLLEAEGEETDVAQNEDEAGGEGMTLADCVDVSKLSLRGTGLSQSDLATLQAAVQNMPAAAFAPYASALAGHPAVRAGCL
jgi:hypothetical protein